MVDDAAILNLKELVGHSNVKLDEILKLLGAIELRVSVHEERDKAEWRRIEDNARRIETLAHAVDVLETAKTRAEASVSSGWRVLTTVAAVALAVGGVFGWLIDHWR